MTPREREIAAQAWIVGIATAWILAAAPELVAGHVAAAGLVIVLCLGAAVSAVRELRKEISNG